MKKRVGLMPGCRLAPGQLHLHKENPDAAVKSVTQCYRRAKGGVFASLLLRSVVPVGSFGSASKSCPQSRQSSPKSSNGCWVRSEPLPHFMECAAQYKSHPQQIRSGFAGRPGNFFMIGAAFRLVSMNLELMADQIHLVYSQPQSPTPTAQSIHVSDTA
jgi:hypothetical protein